ncbi:hypothetical protein PUN4_280138 [Paraburkholderia unamae]|nr:hypothetical protein PUN4_280138 [Paraburkholderia unamae]
MEVWIAGLRWIPFQAIHASRTGYARHRPATARAHVLPHAPVRYPVRHLMTSGRMTAA